MKFTPRALKENVNISSQSPLRELLVLLGGILGGALLIYLILGFALDILVTRMPPQLEQALGKLFSQSYKLTTPPSSVEIKVQELLDELAQLLPPSQRSLPYTVHIKETAEANALALPGGHILIFSGLLEEIESENELSMILAHELGHFVQRDHLRGLGRGLVLVSICSILFGADSTLADFAQRILITAELKFSRQQEVAADMFALELLHRKYGHVAGAVDFFQRLKEKRNLPRFAKFLSTHPYPLVRINLLQEEIRRKGYLIKERVPLKLFLLD